MEVYVRTPLPSNHMLSMCRLQVQQFLLPFYSLSHSVANLIGQLLVL